MAKPNRFDPSGNGGGGGIGAFGLFILVVAMIALGGTACGKLALVEDWVQAQLTQAQTERWQARASAAQAMADQTRAEAELERAYGTRKILEASANAVEKDTEIATRYAKRQMLRNDLVFFLGCLGVFCAVMLAIGSALLKAH